jgi:thioredoxin reductase (NADPH)
MTPSELSCRFHRSEVRSARSRQRSDANRPRVSGEDAEVPTRSLFVMVGAEPHTAWLEDTVVRDRRGFIPTGDEISAAVLSDNDWATQGRGPYLLETSLPGVFAVGDVRANSVKRVATAVGEGSMAVRFAQQYLGQLGS